MLIRTENPNDYNEIYELIKAAFQTAEISDGDEQDYAIKLRNSDKYIPELALVAVLDDKIIGHIMLTKTYIETDSGKVECLLLSPISVLSEYRNKGVGTQLINTALNTAKNMDYKAVFLCGDPAYYGRFGFISVSNYDIKPAMDIPIQYVLVCEIEHGRLKYIRGTINII